MINADTELVSRGAHKATTFVTAVSQVCQSSHSVEVDRVKQGGG